MRILLGVHQFFPDHYTGTERYVLNLAKQMQRMGHMVKVLTYGMSGSEGFSSGYTVKMMKKEYVYEGVPVISLRHRIIPDNHEFVFEMVDEDLYAEVSEFLRKNEFDLYHCAHPLRIISSINAARDRGLKVVCMLTDYFFMCPLGIMLRMNRTLCDGPDGGRNCRKYCFTELTDAQFSKRAADSREVIRMCDRLMSPSQFLIGLFDYAKIIPSSRFVLSRHGFDYSGRRILRKKKKDTLTFGYIGTVQFHKGVHIMVEGFKKVKSQNINLQVWGGCFHEVKYRNKVQKIASADSRIQFMGAYEYRDSEKILDGIDVVIVPSIWYENAPLTITTSLAQGIPVVTSNIGGMGEMVRDGLDGFTFEVGSSADLADKIRMLADTPGLVGELGGTIRYPIRVEEEAFNTELVYKNVLS